MGSPSLITCFGVLLTVACAMVVSANSQTAPLRESATKTRVYISTYTEQGRDGIYLAELDSSTGDLRLIRMAAAVKKASFLAIHPSHRYLYSTCEVDDYRDSKRGAVSAFKIDLATGNLTLLNHQSSGGEGPHYLSLDREGKNALVANYHGGSVAVLPIRADGTLGAATSIVLHHGSSVDKSRQTGPHPHAIDVDPTNRFVFVPDLGLDKVLSYRFDPAAGSLAPNNPTSLATSPGAGPRHIRFHPNGKWAYVINELDSKVNALRFNSEAGVLTPMDTVSTLPVGAKDENITGELVVHPNGRFLYGSNRGHDSIALFAIDQTTGRLNPLGRYPAGGRTPRNFNIDPSGKFLVLANLDSDSVTVLTYPVTGKLSPPNCDQSFAAVLHRVPFEMINSNESASDKHMKITHIETHVCHARMRNWVFVKVVTDQDGLVGWGEATLEWHTRSVVGAIEDVSQLLVGEDPTRIEHLWQMMWRQHFWHGSGIVRSTAIAGIDIALWDILGKLHGVPCHELWGGPVRDYIRLYCHLGGGKMEHFYDTPVDNAQQFGELARQALAEGFTAFKSMAVPPTLPIEGLKPIKAAEACVAEMREAVGDNIDIMVDCHARRRRRWDSNLQSARAVRTLLSGRTVLARKH